MVINNILYIYEVAIFINDLLQSFVGLYKIYTIHANDSEIVQ
jgi:hypothetical protein